MIDDKKISFNLLDDKVLVLTCMIIKHWFQRGMPLGSTQPLTEMSTRSVRGGKGRPARKADSLTALCEPIV
jgi:hypothetical protein